MEVEEFEALFKPSKRYINIILLSLNILVFLVDVVIERRTGYAVVHFMGLLNGNRVFFEKEYWRLVTYMFLHADLEHLFNNMLILYFMGNYMERMIGSFRYLMVYLLSGIFAAFGSVMMNGMDQFCVGASGAIFGVFGAVFFLVLADKAFPVNLRKIDTHMTLRQILVFVVLSVYSGYTATGIDNAAHVTGLIAGFVLTGLGYFVLPFSDEQRKKK